MNPSNFCNCPSGCYTVNCPAAIDLASVQQELETVRAALAQAIFCRSLTTKHCIDYDPAGSTYEVDWTPEAKKWCELAGVDLTNREPIFYD